MVASAFSAVYAQSVTAPHIPYRESNTFIVILGGVNALLSVFSLEWEPSCLRGGGEAGGGRRGKRGGAGQAHQTQLVPNTR